MTIRSVCIVGPGAIGGMMALKLKRAGYEVSALARPAKVAEIAARGMTVRTEGQIITDTFRAADDPRALGPHDLVVIATKSGALPDVARHLPALSKPDTPWVFVLNGVPWFFLDHIGGAFRGRRLATVDPGDKLRALVPEARLIWGVINCSVSVQPDGSLNHVAMNQLILGRPDDAITDALTEAAAVFRTAGYNTETSDRIHAEIWHKLQNNVTFNTVSAVTMATNDLIINDPLVCELCVRVADETRAVGEALGLKGGPTGEERFPKSSSRPSGTSMLSDMMRGRPLELDALIAVVVELSELTGVPAPFTRMLYGLARLRARTAVAA
jgi:2-dehydropantoate 2-reductase